MLLKIGEFWKTFSAISTEGGGADYPHYILMTPPGFESHWHAGTFCELDASKEVESLADRSTKIISTMLSAHMFFDPKGKTPYFNLCNTP